MKEGDRSDMKIILSNASLDPIYQQIMDQIKALIVDGELGEGEALPSIRVLAQGLKISVITTKRAYEELEREGYLETVPGKGSFVAGQNQALLREKRLKIVEEKLAEGIFAAKAGGLSLPELEAMLRLLYEE